MDNLIPVNYDTEEPTVSAKDLNAVLCSYGSNMACPQMRSVEHQASIIRH